MPALRGSKTNQPMSEGRRKDTHYEWAEGIRVNGNRELFFHNYTRKDFVFDSEKFNIQDQIGTVDFRKQ